MDEQTGHTKRKRYDERTYARLLEQLTGIMQDVPKLRPDRDAWDVEGDWAATGVIYFVDAHYQPLFESLRDFDCRTIKLVNMDRPAVRLTFYRKHRYKLVRDKDLSPEEKTAQIQSYINGLAETVYALQSRIDSQRAEVKNQISHCRQQIEQWRAILAEPKRYEIALSNYNRQHFYVTVNYKYRLADGSYDNEQEHLLNTQRDRLGNITQVRYNILFIDTSEILREHPYQNREIENYLNGFPIQSDAGRLTIYARLRADDGVVEGFG